MGKIWRCNPFYWIGRHRMRFASESVAGASFAVKPFAIKKQYPLNWHNLNPFRWSKRAIRVFTAGFFLITLPIYIFIGMQPAMSINTEGMPVLKIADLNLETPVQPLSLENQELIAPANIAGSYSNHTNKTLIIGHSSTIFKTLNQVEVGDALDYDGQTFIIIGADTLEKSEISMNEILAPAAENTIIIMTCAGKSLPHQDATHRLIVTAVLENNL